MIKTERIIQPDNIEIIGRDALGAECSLISEM